MTSRSRSAPPKSVLVYCTVVMLPRLCLFLLWHLAAGLRLPMSPTLSRRAAIAAAASTAATHGLPAFAERNVVTKEEAKEQAANMIRRTDEAGECDAKCEKEIEDVRPAPLAGGCPSCTLQPPHGLAPQSLTTSRDTGRSSSAHARGQSDGDDGDTPSYRRAGAARARAGCPPSEG